MSNPEQSVRLATESIAGRRPYQEDAVLARRLSDGRTLVAVADGMGGHAAGEVASALAMETLLARMEEGRPLDEAFQRANREVHIQGKEPGRHGMGTTLVAAVLDEETFQVANVGDSRAYLIFGDGIRQLTRDHSFVAEAVRKGEPEERARESLWKDALTRSIGNSPEVEVDVFGPFPLKRNTAILLCSDGLYKTLTEADLHQLYLDSSDSREACESLVSSAFARGSDDNITVAAAEIGEIPRKRFFEIPTPGTRAPEAEEPEGLDPEAEEPGGLDPERGPLEPGGSETGKTDPGGSDQEDAGRRKGKGWWPFGKGLLTLILAAALGGCSGETGGPAAEEGPEQEPRPSEIVLQAVDAATGSTLDHGQLRVRHLVRYPITLDESSVEVVPASDPYHIRHAVARDSLVVEVRLEAPSYHRQDTVLRVARGETADLVMIGLTRQPTGGDADQTGQVAARPGTGEARPTTTPPAASDPDAGIDRTALGAGDRAFQRRDWVAATNAYREMPEPPRETGTYAGEYARALVRLGEAHIQLGEMAGALDALEMAVGYPAAGYQAHLLLGQVQCTVGRFDAGRESVRRIQRMAPEIPAAEWGTARALAAYQRAHCTYQEFQRVDEPLDILRVGSNAIDEYEDFIEEGEALSPVPPAISSALEEARIHIEEIRERMRSGGQVPETLFIP
ncbi:MAG: protein phosphatase 2C domain-containing protein [Longimicrobiales bacterium]